jgi:hypothetical protein
MIKYNGSNYKEAKAERDKYINSFKDFIEYSENNTVIIPKKLAKEILDIIEYPLPVNGDRDW